jgi:hypothetical protein
VNRARVEEAARSAEPIPVATGVAVAGPLALAMMDAAKKFLDISETAVLV